MGWANCGEDSQGRPIGYAHEGICDHPGCEARIDRGLEFACGGMHGDTPAPSAGDRAMTTCTRCSLCCAAFQLSRVDVDDVERLGREFFTLTEEGHWELRRVMREWAPWATQGVCVFLRDDLRCAVHDEKPGLCSGYQCVDEYGTRAKLEFAVAQVIRIPGENEPDLDRVHRRYNAVRYGWIPAWYGPTAPGGPPVEEMFRLVEGQ